MFESIFIVALVIIFYARTMRFSVIVDDIRHYAEIHKGLFFRPKHVWDIALRLYGGGTFAHKRACRCGGAKGQTPCKQCNGTGQTVFIDCPMDHLFTTAIFAATCVAIYWALGANVISLSAAILYACNPINNQTSIWLNGRRYSINVLLTLLMLLSAPFGLLFYAMTPFLQVNAIFAPVLLGGWYLAIIPLAVAYRWKRITKFYTGRMKDIVNDDLRSYGVERLVVIVKTFGFYVVKMLFPGRTQMVYDFISGWGMTVEGNKEAYRIDKYFWIGIVSLLSVGVGMVLLPNQQKLFLAFLALSTLQFCNIITPTQTAADRYVSMPNVFLMYFVAYFAHMYLGQYALPVVSSLCVYYLANLDVTMRMYKDIYSFYEYHNYFYPSNVILRKFRVNWLLKTRDVMGAWELVKIGLAYKSTDFSMNFQAAQTLLMLGDHESAKRYLAVAEENHYLKQEPKWRESLDKMHKQIADIEAATPRPKNRVALQPSDWKK